MSLAPKLKKIPIKTKLLLLDPNNPRLFTQQTERVPLDQVHLAGLQSETEARIAGGEEEKYRILDLMNSLQTNTYLPEAGGYIIVRRLQNSEQYLVLEGNRRLVAIRRLLRLKDTPKPPSLEVIESIESIDVLELIDDIPENEIQDKISYLLGTCHHGSQKSWTPFAQARGIYERYQEGKNDEAFIYDIDRGLEVASLLSIKETEVKERLTVYRAMQQLSAVSEIQAKDNGGIIGYYYSLVSEAVYSRSSEIKKYIPKNPDTFVLEPIALERMINLCNFDGTRERKSQGSTSATNPAMNNPKQWRYLGKILADSNAAKREENLSKVEEGHEQPEEVWAERSAELRRYTWKKWLEQVNGILKKVDMGFEIDEEAKAVINQTLAVVDELGQGSDS